MRDQMSSIAVVVFGLVVLWLTSSYPAPGKTRIVRSRLTSAVTTTLENGAMLPSNRLTSASVDIDARFVVKVSDLSASGQHGSTWKLPAGEHLTVDVRVADSVALTADKMCAGPDEFPSGTCKFAQERIERCVTRLWREFIAGQTATMVVGMDIKRVNADMLRNMTRDCPYAGLEYTTVSVSKPHAPDDDDDERAADALKGPIYEAAARANQSVVAAQARTEVMLAETRAAVAAVEAQAAAVAAIAAANATAAIRVIEANATLLSAAAEAKALLVLANAEAEAEAARSAQRVDEFQSRLEVVARIVRDMGIAPDAHGLAQVLRAATWASRPGATLLSEGAPMPALVNATL